MSKDCPNCPAFGKHCPHKLSGDPYFYDCYLTVAELEKENAELKAENEANENGAKKYAEYYFETNDQLIKAKEIIKGILEITEDCKMYKNVYKQAKQFLNSEVEK